MFQYLKKKKKKKLGQCAPVHEEFETGPSSLVQHSSTGTATHTTQSLHTPCKQVDTSTAFFLGAVAKLRKATISPAMIVCLSVRPNGITRFPLDGFSWNFIFEYFSKICRENSSFIKIWQKTDILYEDVRKFIVPSRWIFLTMRIVSDKRCRENQNTQFMFSNFFPKIVLFIIKCEKIWQSQTDHRWLYGKAPALCTLDN